ncbi:unnamed protein product [Soboliphyme baturini]|uniref:Fibronectin type-III domain-containing protein n=1 Tax=Soboliphyme baturini TaxID=241478 RepID=A0A183J5P8_9BILA|nr:unnamed protein product [Soboliphyme baturini]
MSVYIVETPPHSVDASADDVRRPLFRGSLCHLRKEECFLPAGRPGFQQPEASSKTQTVFTLLEAVRLFALIDVSKHYPDHQHSQRPTVTVVRAMRPFVVLLWSSASVLLGFDVATCERHEPLVYSFDPLDPGRVTIHWNQLIPVTRINDLSSREVYYQMDNVTHVLSDEFGHWQTLLTDDNDVGKVARFVFIKHHLCREKEFRISWVGDKNDSHTEHKVRLGSSPTAWAATFDADIAKPVYDQQKNEIRIGIKWNVTSNPLDERLVVVKPPFPSLQLRSCTNIFSKWVEEPYFDEKISSFVLDPQYAESNCDFVVSLNVMTYHAEHECKELHRTSIFSGPIVKLACNDVEHYPCDVDASADICKYRCKGKVTSEARRGSRPGSDPYVTVAWEFPPGKPITSYTVRTSEVDFIWNNHPIAEYNTTLQNFRSNVTKMELLPFSKLLNTFYTFQVCANLDGCSSEPDWTKAPNYPIFVNGMIMSLPPPPTPTPRTTRRTTKTTTTAAARSSTIRQRPVAKADQSAGRLDGTQRQPQSIASPPSRPISSLTTTPQQERTQAGNPNSSIRPSSILFTVIVCYLISVFY